jgi:hypothetical protein
MFYIIESDYQLNNLEQYFQQKTYMEVISSNDNFHPKFTHTVAVYLYPEKAPHGYIIPISHSEGLNVDKTCVSRILSQFKTLYVLNKKNMLYHLPLHNLIDVSILTAMTSYSKVELGRQDSTLNWFYTRLGEQENLNALIPITKLHENCEEKYKSIKHLITQETPPGFEFYNNIASPVFYLIEQTGLRIIYEPFIKLFTPENLKYSIKDNIVYTSYNLNNTTSRPTNAFNNINFAAIPKAPEYRKAIIPQNDFFVEFDFDGYHLRLLCEQIGYTLTDEPAHTQLARLYFNKQEISEEEYTQAKQINFHAIYGKIPPEYAFLEVFEKIDQYIKTLWSKFNQDGFIEDPISKRRFTSTLKDMHPQKLMNYLMQSLETSRNILILKEVLKYLQNKKTKVALYTYDAVLLDFSKEDGIQTLEDLKKIMESSNNYVVKFKYSKNLVL